MIGQTRSPLRAVVALLCVGVVALQVSQAAAESFAPDLGSTDVEEKPDIGPPEVVDGPDMPPAVQG